MALRIAESAFLYRLRNGFRSELNAIRSSGGKRAADDGNDVWFVGCCSSHGASIS
jgi:hypothetical protein